jgi:CDP-diacylglycerol---glycerol-3-phosphate 3-phosphatidyltransferase
LTIASWITCSRIVLIPLFIYFLLSGSFPGNSYIAAGIFTVVAFSDLLDGFVARRFKQESELGKFLDPLADKLLILSGLVCLVEMGKVDAVPVIIILAREFLVQGLRIWHAKAGTIVAATTLSKWKTFLQMLTVVFLILDLPLAWYLLWLTVAVTLISAWGYIKPSGIKNEEINN